MSFVCRSKRMCTLTFSAWPLMYCQYKHRQCHVRVYSWASKPVHLNTTDFMPLRWRSYSSSSTCTGKIGLTSCAIYCTILITGSVTGHKWSWTEPIYKIITGIGGPWTCCQTRHLFIIIKCNININVLPLAAGLLCVMLLDAIFTQYPQANSHISWVKLSSFMSHELVMNLKISVTDHAGLWTHELRCSRCHGSHPMNLWSKWYSTMRNNDSHKSHDHKHVQVLL